MKQIDELVDLEPQNKLSNDPVECLGTTFSNDEDRRKHFLGILRAGFKKAWQKHDYVTTITVLDKIPENVIQVDLKFLIWYKQAITR
jgi:hypothetical protein